MITGGTSVFIVTVTCDGEMLATDTRFAGVCSARVAVITLQYRTTNALTVDALVSGGANVIVVALVVVINR